MFLGKTTEACVQTPSEHRLEALRYTPIKGTHMDTNGELREKKKVAQHNFVARLKGCDEGCAAGRRRARVALIKAAYA